MGTFKESSALRGRSSTRAETRPASAPRSSRLHRAAIAGLACALTIAATAQAQSTDPHATIEQAATENDLDTDATPVAKKSDLWTLVHGAEYPKTEVIEGSVTSFDTDLFAVQFQNRTIGLAGGAACALEPVRQSGEDEAAFGERVAECRGTDGAQVSRVPTLYRYDEPPDDDPGWDRLELPGSPLPGYIAAITWIDKNRALIVGGTGAYPRREAPADGKEPTDPTKADEAGKARAWVYTRESDSVEEVDLSELTADDPGPPARAGMRGLTAVGCYVDPTPGIRNDFFAGFVADHKPDLELCFAGGLGQVWEWRDGRFNGTRIDADSPSAELADPSLFRYRVRDLAFGPNEPPMAVAVTAGCCGSQPGEDQSQTLVFNEDPTWERSGNPSGYGPPTRDYEPASPRWYAGANVRPEMPDSHYSLMASPGNYYDDTIRISVTATPGGPEAPGEQASMITAAYTQRPSRVGDSPQSLDRSNPTTERSIQRQDGLRRALSTARLVAADGDVAGTDPNRLSGTEDSQGFHARRQQGLWPGLSVRPTDSPDGQPDWVMGELRSTKLRGLGARGLVVATALPPGAWDVINASATTSVPPSLARPTLEEMLDGWEPADQAKLDAYIRSAYYLLPSYSANAIDVVGDQEDGWAVGDHGAILRLSATATEGAGAADEPKPPRLGQPRQRPLSDRDAYADARPEMPRTVGPIPRLGDETIELDEPRIVPGNAPAGGQIIMSRDGSEGWAIGNVAGKPWLSYFDGFAWSRCQIAAPDGSAGDPACAGLVRFLGWKNENGQISTTRITGAQRIPLENDRDPTNDDELEILATTSMYRGPETEGKTLPAVIARYIDGRWRIEAKDVPPSDTFAFTAPDDGWAIQAGANDVNETLFHFDGSGWLDCLDEPLRCGDGDGRLALHSRRDYNQFKGLEVAGDRVYLYGKRVRGPSENPSSCIAGTFVVGVCDFDLEIPLIVYHDRDGKWTDGSGEGEDGGGFDPGFAPPGSEQSGSVDALAVLEVGEGEFEGWAAGRFSTGAEVNSGVGAANDAAAKAIAPDAALMRLEANAGGWQRFRSPGPLEDYLLGDDSYSVGGGLKVDNIVTYPSESHPNGTFIGDSDNRIYGFDSERQRFRQLQTGRAQGLQALTVSVAGRPRPAGGGVTASDQQGGFWSGAYHYTDKAPKPVFTEAPAPLGIRGADLVDIEGAPDGSVWVASDSDRIFRHDRIAGWEEVRVPGWDPGRVVTRPSRAAALAIGPDSSGLLVGEGGRIAELSAEAVSLDAAAGRSCALGDPAPCSSSRDLRAVKIAPDGSAIAAGERLALLWRPPGGEFRAIAKPAIASATTITKLAFPTPTRAYLLTDRGIVFRGEMSAPGEWRWLKDNVDAKGDLVSLDAQGKEIAIRDLFVDAFGHGYAVGDDGLVLERDEETRWRRLPTRLTDDLTAIDVPIGEGEGVLIGGEDGLVLAGDPAAPHVASYAEPLSGSVVGFAYLPGSSEGSVDAWAGLRSRPSSQSGPRLLRYRSDPDDPGLGAPADTAGLPDAPPHDADELSLAAFGKSDCEFDEGSVLLCPEMTATTTTNELVSQRIVEELTERREDGELDGALQTGDAVDSAGLPASSLADVDRLGSADAIAVTLAPTALAGQLKHRRYAEHVTQALEDEGVRAFGAIGANDLTEAYACNADTGCERTKRFADGGENFGWREGFGGRVEPWGDASDALESQAEGEASFEPAPGSQQNSLRTENQRVDADGDGPVPEAKAEIGGANTHYALDALRDGEAIARIVVVDTSLKSLAASEPLQQPQEFGGGQQRFLERMICKEGQSSTFGDRCTREKDQRAIVVSNIPTYSYGPGALTHTATDATTFEATMLRYDVDLVVSGALGYNGLYYTLAPGLHEPCPGGEHPEGPPTGKTPDCLDAATGAAGVKAPDPNELVSVINAEDLRGVYPTVIASGAGGKFGPDGTEGPSGPEGRWHGYSVARLMPDGDLVVEQRPILDWVGLEAARHVVRPREKLLLNGYGRSPLSTNTANQWVRAFHYEISTPAITHSYDLLKADPKRPWLPLEDAAGGTQADGPEACQGYVCLPEEVATVDSQSGQVKAGSGKHPPTYAIAMLSVGEEVATTPLFFEPSPSFRFEAPIAPRPTPNVGAVAAPGTPSAPTTPQVPNVSVPTPPVPPALVPPPPAPPASPPQPPVPPPVPPANAGPSALSLSFAPTGLVVAPTASVIPPPAPPINPAPPGGARKEARQRQAATQDSGAGADSGSENASGGDLADGPPEDKGTASMTRLESSYTRAARSRPEPSFTAYRPATEGTSWTTGALYGGGLAFTALALALGWTHGRPTPRRRTPEIPAPAASSARRRQRF